MLNRAVVIIALVAAGEVIFALPFVVARVFRPTMLEVFGLTNLEFGTAFSLYGIVAMLAYFPGGPLADRFPARYLMTVALMVTALGGIGPVQSTTLISRSLIRVPVSKFLAATNSLGPTGCA